MLLRAWYAVAFFESPLAHPGLGGHDRALYHRVAQESFFPDTSFGYMPLYPWALRLIYALFGADLRVAAAFGIACDSATAALIVLSAARLGAPLAVSALAGMIYAFYPLAVVYSVQTMPNTLNAFLVALFAWASGGILKNAGSLRWIGLGLLGGVAALGWAAWLVMAPAWGVTICLISRDRRPLRKPLALFFAAFCLPIVPIAIHNTRAEGSFVLLTTHGGFNFYVGNHERATGHPVRVRDFRMTAADLLEDAHREAERQAGRSLTRAESSAWWSAQARTFWREQPIRALALLVRKAVLVWHRTDVDDLRLVELSSLLVDRFRFNYALWPGFGLIAWAGLIGALRAPRAWPARSLLLAGAASMVMMFITARYRLALAPLMLSLGAAGIAELWRDIRSRHIFRALLLASISATLVSWPFAVRDQTATDHYNAAVHLLQAERYADALRMAERGLAIDPASAPLYHAHGEALFRLGRFVEAADSFARAFAIDPAHGNAAYNRALSLARSGDFRAARDALKSAAHVRPLSPQAIRLLAELEAMEMGE